jgi:glycosyltransferase involved in cell wall biosynthesis
MRVGLNLLYLLPGVVGGTQTYAQQLLHELVQTEPDTEFVAYVNEESSRLRLVDAPNLRVVTCPVRATSRPRRYLFEQVRLPSQVARDGIDVLHSLGYVGPLRTPCAHVVTVHDLIYVGFAEHMAASRRLVLKVMVRLTARRADRVITVSQSSRQQILDDIGLAPSDVVVISEAPRPGLDERGDAPLPAEVEPPYVLALGSVSPSKNLPRLVRAFSGTAASSTHQLVLVGRLPADDELDTEVERCSIGSSVLRTGYVSDQTMVSLLQHAAVFAFPSLYEGFGLPVLDAQLAGVPVVCSSAASLPEVAGNGALLFDPLSVSEIAAAIDTVVSDPDTRSKLIEAGRANVARYSWARCARETMSVYRSVLGGRQTLGGVP